MARVTASKHLRFIISLIAIIVNLICSDRPFRYVFLRNIQGCLLAPAHRLRGWNPAPIIHWPVVLINPQSPCTCTLAQPSEKGPALL